MPKFRKKPVVIEAIQVPSKNTNENIGEHGALGAWMEKNCGGMAWAVVNGAGEIAIETLEGVMRAKNGDWIIKGVQGELYPCKPDIFEATYEPCLPSVETLEANLRRF